MRCIICTDPRVTGIDAALRRGCTLREIVDGFPGVAKDSVNRHRKHAQPTESSTALVATPQPPTASAPARQEHANLPKTGDDLIDEAKRIAATGWHLLAKAEEANELRTSVGALREVRGTVELQGKLTGRFSDTAPSTRVLIVLPGVSTSVSTQQSYEVVLDVKPVR